MLSGSCFATFGDMSNKVTAAEIFTSRLDTGSRTYFFDLKRGPSGSKRLEVSESRKRRGEFERDRIMVFEEDVGRFVIELLKAVSALAEPEALDGADLGRGDGGQYARAYREWTPDEDQELKAGYERGVCVADLALKHGRRPGAIRSRLRRLLTDPLNPQSPSRHAPF